MNDLTLPGTIPGLLRRGSPCFIGHGAGCKSATISQILDHISAEVTAISETPQKRVSFSYTLRSLHLDLADATGRFHAALRLSKRLVNIENPMAAWVTATAISRFEPFTFRLHVVTGIMPNAQTWKLEEALSEDLDPDDARRLPDGSRWVDVEVLRRAVRHAEGLPYI